MQDSSPETIWTQAYEFVETNKKIIAGYARRFLPYSSYPIDEFIQQAYESAYHALQACITKQNHDKYIGYFWMQYLRDCSKMANIPSKKKLYEKCIKNSIKNKSLVEEILKELSCSPIIHEEYKECHTDNIPATTTASPTLNPLQILIDNEEALGNELKELIQEETIKKALMLMTKREKQSWEYRLGHHHNKKYTINEIALMLNIKKSKVIKLKKNALLYIQKIFSAYGQNFYTIQELSEKAGCSIADIKYMKQCGILEASKDYIQRSKKSNALFTNNAIQKLNSNGNGNGNKGRKLKTQSAAPRLMVEAYNNNLANKGAQ